MYMFNKYWRNSYFFLVHLDIILILVLRIYSGLSGRVRTMYLFSLCVVSLLSRRFTDSALVCNLTAKHFVPCVSEQIYNT
jgi:hypothetical protein